MSKTYSFVEQLEMGEAGEQILDEYFSKWYDIKPATPQEQRQKKIDRWFRHKDSPNPNSTPIEYKTDDKTDRTGNLFIETWSNEGKRVPGWVYSTWADVVIYFALPDTLYIMKTMWLRSRVSEWQGTYGTRSVKNKGYRTIGIPVPTKVVPEKFVRRLD